jgi:hypothetical protein
MVVCLLVVGKVLEQGHMMVLLGAQLHWKSPEGGLVDCLELLLVQKSLRCVSNPQAIHEQKLG